MTNDGSHSSTSVAGAAAPRPVGVAADHPKSAAPSTPNAGSGSRGRRVLPTVATKLSPVGAIARLDKASRRGRLPGFHQDADDRCRVAAHGNPFDRELLVAAIREADGRTRLRFQFRLPKKMPTIFALSMLIMIEPGQILTHSILRMYFDFYGRWTDEQTGWLSTWMWYYPLTIPWIPWIWGSAMKRTRDSSFESATKMVEQISKETAGEIEKA